MSRTGRAVAPALLALVERKWLDQASVEFRGGKERIFFGTNSPGVGPTRRLTQPPSHVYFKPNGSNEVQARAKFVKITEENPSTERLIGSEHEEWRFYYGFTDLAWLKIPRPITSLRYYSTNNALRNDVAGSCVIVDPEV